MRNNDDKTPPSKKQSAEKTVQAIRRATRRKYSTKEKIRIVLEKAGWLKLVGELGLDATDNHSFMASRCNKCRDRQTGKIIK